MNDSRTIDCKHCINHYINGRHERKMNNWCSEERCVKVKDENYYYKAEEDYIIILEREIKNEILF